MVQDEQHELGPALQFQLKKHESVPAILEEYGRGPKPTTPSEWFCQKFPGHAEKYGAPVLEVEYPTMQQTIRTNPVALNEDFLAAVLGSNAELGHHVVFYHPEQQFYFFDSRCGYYVATTEAKLMTLLSQILIHCAQDMPEGVDLSNLFILFRSENALRKIIKRAKSMLLAAEGFFVGSSGRKRLVGLDVLDPTAEPAYKIFIKEGIVQKTDQILTMSNAFETFTKYCQIHGFKPMDRRYFKGLICDAIKEEFGLGLRKDLKNEVGKSQNGWKGLALTFADTAIVESVSN